MRPIFKIPVYLAVIAVSLGIGQNALAQDGDPKPTYVRFERGERAGDAALQTAVAHFRHPDKNVEVILYGVVHIADMDFFDRVQEDLDGYDMVLYEGVGRPGEKPDESMKGLGEIQGLMGEAMGLSFQKEGIDYTRKNLVHADMSMEELQEAMGGGSISPLGNLLTEDQVRQMLPILKAGGKILKGFLASIPRLQDQMKLMLGNQLGNADLQGALGQRATRAILYDRNQVVFDILEEKLATAAKKGTRTIAIFYGAAHHPDLEKRLEAIGFGQTSKRWMTAWTIGNGVGTTPQTRARGPKMAPRTRPVRPIRPGRTKDAPKSGRWF